MRIWLQAGLGVGLALAMTAGVQAQARFHVSAPVRVSVPTGVRALPLSGTQPVVQQSSRNVVVVGAGSPFGFSDGGFPAPGLGFDYVHLAAIQRALRGTSFHRFDRDGRFSNFGGFFLPIGMGAYGDLATPQVIVVQQPPVVIMQSPATEQAAAAPHPAPEAAPPAPQEPLPDLGEYVLVRRDGTVAFAVAFFTQGDQLIYVTREGIRRSIPLAGLDLDATRRMNEERGLAVQLPG